MKRSDLYEEVSLVIKEPRLEGQELRTSSSSATEQLQECVEEDDKLFFKDQSSSVKKALRRSLELKQQRKELQAAAEELSSKRIAEGAERLREWSKVLSGAGYFCEVRSLMTELSPFPQSLVEQEPSTYRFALVVYHSRHLMFDSSTGPFQAVRLVIFPDGEWRLDSPIYEHRVVSSGTLSLADENSMAVPKELMEQAQKYVTDKHVLCPGLLEVEDLHSLLGYIPKTLTLFNGPVTTVHSNSCKIWHIPAKNVKSKAEDNRHQRVCRECLISGRYVKKAIQEKRTIDSSKRHERKQPSSNYPMKYLTPKSKTARYANSRLQRHRLEKHVKKLYKRTKVELPQGQSAELCQLIESIESSDEGKKELTKIFNEGNQLKSSKGYKAGDFLKEVWRKDRESFFKDQRSNAVGKNGNRWSMATIRMALAVYNRSPSAYEALRDLKILQLPHSKTLKKVIKGGSEKSGIDEGYLRGQQKIYEEFQRRRETEGHPRPLGIGVMMWDEVKIQMKVAWNLKGAGITGYSVSEDELKVLHDDYRDAVQPGPQKASYIVQFLWRELTSGFDLIGPYFPVESSMTSHVLQEFIMLCLKALTSYGFKISILLCDGASSNLTVLKLLSGNPNTQFPHDANAATLRERFNVEASLINPEDPYGNPLFLMICPSHQLKNMIAALYSSRPEGSKDFTQDNHQFGWKTIQKVFAEDLERAENGLSRKVPGLKYAHVYRDNWTRLNVRPAKIMQQRYMIAAVKDLSSNGTDVEASTKTGEYLDACNLLFEQGLLSHRRVNNKDSSVLKNIKQGMSFFEQWCADHMDTVYQENTKRARQKKFLAWQTWDLLRLVVHGFLAFCNWFFDKVSPNGKYFISPLRINGSAIESIYSVLKFASGGNLSALSYGPALGKLINRKDMVQNKYSEKGYRDVTLNISGSDGGNVSTSITNVAVYSQKLSNSLCIFSFPANIAQSTVGDRQGSNACTIIAVRFGDYCNQQNLDISLLWNELPNVWVDSFVNSICDGNALYDELYGDTAVYLDVEDVVNDLGQECHVQSANQMVGFTSAHEYRDLVDHISGAMHASTTTLYGILIGCQKSVGLLLKTNGLCAIIDSHQHVTTNSGGVIIMADHPKNAILEYSNSLSNQGYDLSQGTLTWVQYA